jgi:tetratricopeptide (TPR) repeat protein
LVLSLSVVAAFEGPPISAQSPATPSTPNPPQQAAGKTTPPDREALAEAAWRPLAGSTDTAAIERFLAQHGSTATAAAARSRLAALREETRREEAAKAAADRAKAEAAARANRQQALDTNWQACRSAADSAKESACAPVIQSDDTVSRRAAALHLVGMAARQAGDYGKAITNYSRSLALVPGDAQVLTDRGIAHFLKGGADGRAAAMRDYDAAIRADPRHAEALNNRAWSLFLEARTAEALADVNRSIEAMPTNGYAYDTRGQILEALGRKEEAVRDFERALSIDPSQETSRVGLARLRAAGR